MTTLADMVEKLEKTVVDLSTRLEESTQQNATNFRLLQANDQKIGIQAEKISKLVQENNTLRRRLDIHLGKDRATKNNVTVGSLLPTNVAPALGFRNAIHFNKEMLYAKVFYCDHNNKKIPHQKFIDRGYFEVKNGRTYVTPAGQALIKDLKEKNYFRV